MRKREEREEAAPLDPVALTLAIWLGCVVGVSGLVRLSEEASAQAALDEASGRPAPRMGWDTGQMYSPRAVAAYGG